MCVHTFGRNYIIISLDQNVTENNEQTKKLFLTKNCCVSVTGKSLYASRIGHVLIVKI